MQIKTQNYHVYIALQGKMFAERCAKKCTITDKERGDEVIECVGG